ncbi:uncharacterized protein SRS1_15563 [Sporisorium reilianum f. sp. reilianum]|uniref:Shugoshin C-terminal domain-containing protein n=1 Tax=Sporisorium reilianum f. sp. reilianum TaxID=72559 RepID=A0A2N8UIH6_9BASI|nr:uncharacterized protein SRS1_15563 [Sporisorium reilianum f. sp. reilianum]
MPPATRREVRLSASLPDPTSQNGTTHSIESSRSATMLIPNMESILENFEQFKRKHISQNREIIKANALNQLRIRELENRIQLLEAEKIQKEMDTVTLTAQVSQLHHAIGTIHAGWEAIGRGLTLSAGHSKQSIGLAPLPTSNRVTVEPNPNSATIVRSVAKPPEGHLDSLKEEHSDTEDEERSHTPLVTFNGRLAPVLANEGFHDEWQHHFQAMRAAQSKRTPQADSHGSTNGATSVLDMDGAPSPMGSPELPMDLEHVIAAATSRSAAHHWSLPGVTPPHPVSEMPLLMQSDDSIRQSLRRSGRKSSRRQSGYFSQNDINESYAAHPSSESASIRSSPAPSSEPYLPSDTNSETMDGVLVYRGADQAPVYRALSQPPASSTLADITNGGYPSPSSLRDHAASQLDANAKLADAAPRRARNTSSDDVPASHVQHTGTSPGISQTQVRTPGGRKRKVPNHEPQDPMPTPARLFSAAIDATPSAPVSTLIDEEHGSLTGRTRRVRKSINYALPKLNTKMRKPDPIDLVPASTPHRSNRTTPASARGMIGSTGNLSDIRRLHEAAALRQSPAERASHMRSKGSPSHPNGDASHSVDDGGVRMADLFEIRQGASHHMAPNMSSKTTSGAAHAFWNADGTNDTSDDDSRVTSNADLGELAELEAAMSDLCAADEVPQQVDTPRVVQSSMWPSRSSAQMSASSSTDSMVSRSSSTASNATAARRPSLRRKTTTLPSRSRQSSAEQAMQAEIASGPDSAPTVDDVRQGSEVGTGPTKSAAVQPTPITETAKTSASARKLSDAKKDSERARPGSAASSSTEIGNGRPPLSAGLAAGMKPKQRPASAGAALLSSRSASASSSLSSSVDRPRTFSGTTAARAGLALSSASSSSSSSLSRSTSSASSSTQRTSLHSALTSQTKATPGQMTPRIGAKGLPVSATPSSKESPRIAGTPTLRPASSFSSLASESTGRSSPALSAASLGSSGTTQLSTSTRTSLKNGAPSGTAPSAKTQRSGTAGSTASSSSSSREGSTLRVNGSASSTSTSAGSARPQPARSMPSLRRASDKAGVTSTPRITVRSSSSTLPAAPASDSPTGNHTTSSAASIAASKVAKAISSTPASRSKDATLTPLGLGIDFDDGSAGKELIALTDENQQVLQRSSSSAAPSSSLSSEAHSSSPTTASRPSSDDVYLPGASVAKARRTSRRVSGMAA